MVIFYIHILLRSVRTCGTMNLSFTTSLSRHPKPELLCLVWTDNQVTPCCHCVLRSWAFTALGFFLEKSCSICSGTVGVNSFLKNQGFLLLPGWEQTHWQAPGFAKREVNYGNLSSAGNLPEESRTCKLGCTFL